MKVKVQFFGHISEITGCKSYTAEMRNSSRVCDVMQILTEKFSSLKGINSFRVAVNAGYANKNTPVKDGDTISYIPPVGGG